MTQLINLLTQWQACRIPASNASYSEARIKVLRVQILRAQNALDRKAQAVLFGPLSEKTAVPVKLR